TRLARTVSADRPGRPRPHLRGGDPGELAVRQGRHRLPAGPRPRHRAVPAAADRVRPARAGTHRRDRPGGDLGRTVRPLPVVLSGPGGRAVATARTQPTYRRAVERRWDFSS